MKRKVGEPRVYLNLMGVLILLVGLGSAVLIYWTAGSYEAGVLGYEQSDGSVYLVRPEDSKQYERNMELYGGKANLLADDFRRWFVGLWHGRSLARTVACITIVISAGVFFYANCLEPVSGPDE
jgi:hypothetical protein